MDTLLESSATIPFVMGFGAGFMLTCFISLSVIFGLERLIYVELSKMNHNLTKQKLGASDSAESPEQNQG